MSTKTHSSRRERIKKHIEKTVRGTTNRPRLVVYRSLKHIYAQLVDDTSSKTVLGVSTLSEDVKTVLQTGAKDKKSIAKQVGIAVAKKAMENNIKTVVFDRNGYQYHGIVKSLAEGAREGGLVF
ncbi:MAG: 50S ribosomal protein L18 [Ignavibacteriae bacterium]|nr:50S ribosomal protein L18 [Ignavibacteriota bacterium]